MNGTDFASSNGSDDEFKLHEAFSRRDFMSSAMFAGASAAMLSALPGIAQAQAPTEGHIGVFILDTYAGRPAIGMRVDLSIQDGNGWKPVNSYASWRPGVEPLMRGDAMVTGNYMLEFFHSEYFRPRAFLPNPPFYDRVVHFFNVPSKQTPIHITFIGSPWGYTTARWKE
jgi:5-hydroxyisourate hydrolase